MAATTKTDICNRALVILCAGATSQASIFLDTITAAQFADYSTVGDEEPDKKLLCFLYDKILKTCLVDIAPDFAKKFADLGEEIKVTPTETAEWEYLFDLPSDYLDLVAQVSQSDRLSRIDSKVITAPDFAHIVEGTDEQAYYCIADHTAADANKPITGASYATYWSLYDEDGDYGATWVSGKAYKSSQSWHILATNSYSNDDGDSAYIEYIWYNDDPTLYTEAFIEAFATKLAYEMSVHSKDYARRLSLLEEYERLAKPFSWRINQSHKEINKSTRKYVNNFKSIFDARSG